MGGPPFPSAAASDILLPLSVSREPSWSLPPVWAQHAGNAVGDGWTPRRGAPTTQTTEHAPAGHPASGWSWRWAECPQAGLSAPSATGGSAGGLSRAAVPVGPGRTSPRSSSLEFRVSLSPVPGAWGAGPHSAPGPQSVSARAPASPAFTAPPAEVFLPPSQAGGPPGGLERRPARGDSLSPSCPLPGRLCSRGHSRASAPAGGFQERRRLMA